MDKPLTNRQLDRMLRPMGSIYKGTFPSDHLPNCKDFTYPYCIIANTDCSHLGGTHWVAMYFDSEGNGHYFDSFGMQPPRNKWLDFLTRNSRSGHWNMQRRKIQSEWSPFCGQYASYYLMARNSHPLSVSDYELMLHLNDGNILHKLSLIHNHYNS